MELRFQDAHQKSFKVYDHLNDLPEGVDFQDSVAVDTETMGLDLRRDRLCLVQLGSRDGDVHLIRFPDRQYDKARNLKALLNRRDLLKIYHYGRFDMAVLYYYLQVSAMPAFCTKIASRLCRTNTQNHGLKSLVKDLLGIELSKEDQCSDWGAEVLTDSQKLYAASDVLYLHRLMDQLKTRLQRDRRQELATASFQALWLRVMLDVQGFEDDIFSHH